jgi:hypothetical protein
MFILFKTQGYKFLQMGPRNFFNSVSKKISCVHIQHVRAGGGGGGGGVAVGPQRPHRCPVPQTFCVIN